MFHFSLWIYFLRSHRSLLFWCDVFLRQIKFDINRTYLRREDRKIIMDGVLDINKKLVEDSSFWCHIIWYKIYIDINLKDTYKLIIWHRQSRNINVFVCVCMSSLLVFYVFSLITYNLSTWDKTRLMMNRLNARSSLIIPIFSWANKVDQSLFLNLYAQENDQQWIWYHFSFLINFS